jgi:glucosamine--fructose-6-phosphate aminotransferase (isomerizing)
MQKEIYQQPGVIERFLQKESKNVEKISENIKRKNIKLIIIAARGTSDRAAILGKYLFEIKNNIPVILPSISVFTLYKAKLDLNNTLCIGISQSGEAKDVIEFLKISEKQGALSLGITNNKNSTMADEIDNIIYLRAGEEKSISATKTYTSQIASLYLLSSFLSDDEKMREELKKIPEEIEKILKMEDLIKNNLERYRYINQCIVLGRGLNYATSLEFALKLEETSYCVAEAFSGADFLHGPIVLVEEGFPVFIFAPSGKTYKMMLNLTKEVKEKGAEIIIISDRDEILKLGRLRIKMPALNELYTPFSYIVAGQLLALHLSLIKGLNPDKPRYLRKIAKYY